ncbi:MAG: glycosyltransferase family 4 protein [Actinobacteria bacterium]|nr:MAG: glycosyltransferase family 4 protein [Actinomycetota bacterium]
MNVLVVSGMWPPDVGGPASHAPEVCEYLLRRGHGVAAVTMADCAPAPERYAVHWASRRTPLVWRHVIAARLVARLARKADIVYSTGMIGRSSLGAALARRPIVLKLTSDPVFERSLRWRLFGADLGAFQDARGIRIGVLRRIRDLALARARRVIIPSEALRELALGWGLPTEKVVVIPNPVSPPELGEREELRRRHGLEGRTLVFAGRMVPQKAIPVALEAVVRNPDVSLVLAGEGPYLERLQELARSMPLDGRARFLGPQPRQAVFELLRAADAALLSSSWENFPHMVVEALAVGTPVLATHVGGVTEILRDGENGLLVPMNDPEALAGAIRRYFDDEALQERLRAAAVASVARFSPDEIYGRLEALLEEVASAHES